MARRWLVDASNVLGSRPDGWWKDRAGALDRLVDEVVRWRADVGEPVTVVCDGRPTARVPAGARHGIDVVYAGHRGRDAADDELIRLLEVDPAPEDVVVATSDRGLRSRVEALGATAEGGGRFLARLADIATRRSDRAVLERFGASESDLLGRGGEARVFAAGDRVIRLPHAHADRSSLEARRELLDHLLPGAAALGVALPEVLDHVEVDGRLVVVERRLPGVSAHDHLADRGTDRAALVRHHLDVVARLADLPCPVADFGEIWGEGPGRAPTWPSWSERRLAASIGAASKAFAHLDPVELTAAVVDAVPGPKSDPVFVHLDAFLGNCLADASRVTAVIDAGPLAIGGVRHLDPLVSVAYLAEEITTSATDVDRAVATAWLTEHGLAEAEVPVRRWLAAFWCAVPDDWHLHRWCRRILLDG